MRPAAELRTNERVATVRSTLRAKALPASISVRSMDALALGLRAARAVGTRPVPLFLGAILFAWTSAARAERGAFSVDIGSGVALVDVRAPYAQGSPAQLGTSLITSLGFRYALSNALELGAAALYEPPTTFTHPGAQLLTSGGLLPGTLSETTQQLGFVARGRFVHGFAWRFVAGTDVGLAIRSFTDIHHYYVADSSPAVRNYGLALRDTSQTALLVAPTLGVEWSSDHVTIGVTPRLELFVGAVRTWSVALPIALSWSWYL